MGCKTQPPSANRKKGVTNIRPSYWRMDHLSLPQEPWHQYEDDQVSWNAIRWAIHLFLWEMITIVAMVSAVSLPVFLGWLYGQFSLVHLQPLQVKSAQILVGRSFGKISVALVSCLVRKNMPMSGTWRCLAKLVAPLRQGFFWRWMAATFVLLPGVDGSCFTLWHWF